MLENFLKCLTKGDNAILFKHTPLAQLVVRAFLLVADNSLKPYKGESNYPLQTVIAQVIEFASHMVKEPFSSEFVDIIGDMGLHNAASKYLKLRAVEKARKEKSVKSEEKTESPGSTSPYGFFDYLSPEDLSALSATSKRHLHSVENYASGFTMSRSPD